MLCRGGGGGQISALEIPTEVGHKKLNLINRWSRSLCPVGVRLKCRRCGRCEEASSACTGGCYRMKRLRSLSSSDSSDNESPSTSFCSSNKYGSKPGTPASNPKKPAEVGLPPHPPPPRLRVCVLCC
ncbi:hypothetical protein INR49_008506 [Caranx melampygus]|nr:hypothetical protein INR49_008506 [Caranx melampygus]